MADWQTRVSPIDIDAIGRDTQRSFWRPSPAQAKSHGEKCRETAARKRKARAAKFKRRSEWKRRVSGLGESIKRIITAMEPGKWYARPDILVLTGLPYGSVKGITQRLQRRGWLERGENPGWKEFRYVKGEGIETQVKRKPPQWLYRLTAEGEVERSKAESEVSDQVEGERDLPRRDGEA